MKKSKFTEAQIMFALQQAESEVTVAEVCRNSIVFGDFLAEGTSFLLSAF